MLSAQLLGTGAFEIQHGAKLVWSSLETKRLPTMVDLQRASDQTGVEFIQLRDPAVFQGKSPQDPFHQTCIYTSRLCPWINIRVYAY